MRPRTRCYRLILGLLTIGLLAGVALLASSVQAASGPGPYYAEPAWDRKLPSTTRFLVLTDWNSDAVLDKETGLVWERSPATTLHTWSEARLECTGRTTGNRKGWRLPSVQELTSLLHPAQMNPALPTGHPFTNVQSTNYWSASTNAENATSAWLVDFNNGSVNGNTGKADASHAWCVRGGMNADAY